MKPRTFTRYSFITFGMWLFLVVLLIAAWTLGGVPLSSICMAITLATVAALVTIREEYKHRQKLPKGFVYVGNHLVTPSGVYCNHCHIASKIDERIPKRKNSKKYVIVYQCPNCRRAAYIDEALLDSWDEA